MERTPTEMELRVAKAICESTSGPWDLLSPQGQSACITEARAAIRAMREPAEEVIEVALDLGPDLSPETYWRAMIDTASPPEAS